VVYGIKVLLAGSMRPQYIVVGDVDKTFFDYIILAKTKGRAARCGVRGRRASVLGLYVLILGTLQYN
jgi:hypothetical protein